MFQINDALTAISTIKTRTAEVQSGYIKCFVPAGLIYLDKSGSEAHLSGFTVQVDGVVEVTPKGEALRPGTTKVSTSPCISQHIVDIDVLKLVCAAIKEQKWAARGKRGRGATQSFDNSLL